MRILLLISAFLTSTLLYSQVHLQKKWDHTYGGSADEDLTWIIQTSDSGFVLAGFTNSPISGDVSQSPYGGYDYWIVRADSSGNKLWEKRFGGSSEDKLTKVIQTSDGGFLLGGTTNSDSSGLISTHSKGSTDFWIVKTDNMGTLVWERRYGGASQEQFGDFVQTPDGGYLIGGLSGSDSTGDFMHFNKGGEDYWVIKTNATGVIQWEKNFGGNSLDQLFSLKQTYDGNFILAGRSASDSSSDVTEAARGEYDYWIIKISASGNKIWDKRYGGDERENLYHIAETNNKGFILGGYTRSDQSGDITETTRDTSTSLTTNRGDVWIVKTDSLGQKTWDHRFGGSWVEAAFGSVLETADSGFLFGCASYSNQSGDKSENNFGYEQSWIVKMDSNGAKQWDRTIFVDGEDEFAYPLESSPGCYVVANYSSADSSGFKSEDTRGNADYWFIKFCETNQPQLPDANFTVNTFAQCEGACFEYINQTYNGSTFHWSFPGGVPSTSDLAFPPLICYPDTGHYGATLIAVNADGSDTITINQIIEVRQPPTFTIVQHGDSLFGPQGYTTYRWKINGVLQLTDTLYYIVGMQNGDYVLEITDSNSCVGTDTLFSFNVAINEFYSNGSTIIVYPNPAKDKIRIDGLDAAVSGLLSVYDLTGRKVISQNINSAQVEVEISGLVPGIYLLEAMKNNHKYFARFIKN